MTSDLTLLCSHESKYTSDKVTYHFSHRSLPSDGLLQLKQTQTDLWSAAAAIQSLSPRSESRRDLTLQTGTEENKKVRKQNKTHPSLLTKESPFSSPKDIHGMLFSRGRCERSEAHHFGRIPQRLLQITSLDVTLKVSQPQHGQVHRMRGDTWQARPLLLSPHDPVIVRVDVVLVVLEVIARGVWIWDCVGLKKKRARQAEFNYQRGTG